MRTLEVKINQCGDTSISVLLHQVHVLHSKNCQKKKFFCHTAALNNSSFYRMPITVHMRDKNSGSLKVIAEYGQEYGKDNPIRVLYNGYGHYDALQIPTAGTQAKL